MHSNASFIGRIGGRGHSSPGENVLPALSTRKLVLFFFFIILNADLDVFQCRPLSAVRLLSMKMTHTHSHTHTG